MLGDELEGFKAGSLVVWDAKDWSERQSLKLGYFGYPQGDGGREAIQPGMGGFGAPRERAT